MKLVHGLLARAADVHGDRTALTDGARMVSYGELDAASSRLAHALIDHGVRPGDRVGLLLEKSLEAVTAAYGIMKAGAVYVPLDESAPSVRLTYIATDADMRCLVSSPARTEAWAALVAGGAPIKTVIGAADDDGPERVTQLPWAGLATFSDQLPDLDTSEDDLAYILYTSGSTGEPKGVMLSHGNCLGFVEWAAREVALTPDDRLSSHAPLHFDLSTFDLYAAARVAASVALVPREATVFPVEAANFIRGAEITTWYSVPSALTQLVLRGGLQPGALPSLRTIIFAGEVFPSKYLARLIELVPQARYLNFYGPTETNVCTWYDVPIGRPVPESLPIGWPIEGVSAVVAGEDGSPAPPGEVGELLITGPTVMHGYWGDAERTARTLSRDGQARTYRTGDLVRENAAGELEFLGRRDAQIKTRGYRVELGEIETALHGLDVVVEAAVVAIPDEAITNRLKAFVVAREPVEAAELARLCRLRLPAYMIPSEFELREELPKSSTGKVDRRALQA